MKTNSGPPLASSISPGGSRHLGHPGAALMGKMLMMTMLFTMAAIVIAVMIRIVDPSTTFDLIFRPRYSLYSFRSFAAQVST